ncbi:DUF4085 family protein [Robertmurraya siralis]|uniref:DUF4085 family protein n=1 Tax=Robertmurraya TaxID=2837507 RepID=UPI0010F65138
MPETILSDIADIRVFTLNKATRSVINAVTKFCEDNERFVDKTLKKYEKYVNASSDRIGKEAIENLSFHDCAILKWVQQDNNLTLLL